MDDRERFEEIEGDATLALVRFYTKNLNVVVILDEDELTRFVDGEGAVASRFDVEKHTREPPVGSFDILVNFGGIGQIFGDHLFVVFRIAFRARG